MKNGHQIGQVSYVLKNNNQADLSTAEAALCDQRKCCSLVTVISFTKSRPHLTPPKLVTK
jgi:hypothetical protein